MGSAHRAANVELFSMGCCGKGVRMLICSAWDAMANERKSTYRLGRGWLAMQAARLPVRHRGDRALRRRHRERPGGCPSCSRALAGRTPRRRVRPRHAHRPGELASAQEAATHQHFMLGSREWRPCCGQPRLLGPVFSWQGRECFRLKLTILQQPCSGMDYDMGSWGQMWLPGNGHWAEKHTCGRSPCCPPSHPGSCRSA